ncbi:MAG: ATP-binding protein [Patescibacteria group bacterium]
MDGRRHSPESEQTMKLKESSHLLAEVLYADGVDIYKRSTEEIKEMEPTIANTRARIDEVLRTHFGTSFAELDTLSPPEWQRIRANFLEYYRGSVEKAEKLKKWIPLNQLVGYAEVLVASAYLQLNTEIDEDIETSLASTGRQSSSSIPVEHTRMKILNAFKRINQGKKLEEIRAEVGSYLREAGIQPVAAMFLKWRTTFEAANHPLQELYAEHVETMQINDAIYDLQFREQKRSTIIQELVGATRRNWKPANLEHDIHSQSAEVNRSIIELTCNAIDADEEGMSSVEVEIAEKGYSVRDHGAGMNPYVILEKLMIPKVSGKTGKETIGRFGVGFYTALSHLKRKNDIVRVETHDGKTGHIIEFKIHERTGDVLRIWSETILWNRAPKCRWKRKILTARMPRHCVARFWLTTAVAILS